MYVCIVRFRRIRNVQFSSSLFYKFVCEQVKQKSRGCSIETFNKYPIKKFFKLKEHDTAFRRSANFWNSLGVIFDRRVIFCRSKSRSAKRIEVINTHLRSEFRHFLPRVWLLQRWNPSVFQDCCSSGTKSWNPGKPYKRKHNQWTVQERAK